MNLFAYGTLMCADIIIHNADKVPVGKDQEQNLEMARKFAKRFNHMYGVEYFTLPEPYNFGQELIKVNDASVAADQTMNDLQGILSRFARHLQQVQAQALARLQPRSDGKSAQGCFLGPGQVIALPGVGWPPDQGRARNVLVSPQQAHLLTSTSRMETS